MKKYLIALAFLLTATPAFAVPTMKTSIITEEKTIPLTLEIAATPPVRERGLMFRKTLAPNDGMIFIFPDIAPHPFWMKNTIIPLDMLFVDAQGMIVYIATGTPMSEMPIGERQSTVQAIIELDGGRAARDGIAVGNKVEYALPPGIKIH